MSTFENDDSSDCNSIVPILEKAKNESHLTDIEFVVGKAQLKKAFSAHTLILALQSPVFEKMFYGDLPEQRKVIETDDDPEAFQMLLNYMYGNGSTITSFNDAFKFMEIGYKYSVPKIQDIVKKYISLMMLTQGAFWHIIKNSILTNQLSIPNVRFYAMENANKIISSGEFLNAPESFVERFLQLDKLNVPEYQLLLHATKWGYRNVKEPDSGILMKFYQHIRFSTLTIKEFFKFIEIYPKAMDAKSKVGILMHLYKKPSQHHKLPKWCSACAVPRNGYACYPTPNYDYEYDDEILID